MDFALVDSLSPEQVDDLLVLYKYTYWAQGRDRAEVERSLSESDYLFGAVDRESGRLCAFARVLSDDVFRAVIFDVVVHPDCRGKGLTKLIFEAILSHPVLGRVESILLYCKDDVIELYERFGFQEYEDMHLMNRSRADH